MGSHIPIKAQEKRNELIEQGLPLNMISAKLGITRQAVSNYIKVSGKSDKWKKERGRFKAAQKRKKTKARINEEKRIGAISR
ncbi:hypothetical protein CMI41_00120 [Candidatus Pacearchaeota archaeon]|nr:hypothetical protein [Candidatus Pacearchaeota archaeon]|tara:strand:- start:4300 stop:4545 length:246 start_codon:yes stop_codon:yes gene_type:complete